MKKYMTMVMVGLAMVVQGCASTSLNDAPTRTFATNKEKVVAALQASIKDLGYNLNETQSSDPTSVITFSRSITAFSWGESGWIYVTRVEPELTKVLLSSDKRSPLQVTGMDREDFASAIFAEVDKKLKP